MESRVWDAIGVLLRIERIAVPNCREKLLLKGGMLVTSMLGVGERLARDSDVTLEKLRKEQSRPQE